MMTTTITLARLNERHRAFWANEQALMERRMADEAILLTAIKDLASEARRGSALYCRKSFEAALADAEAAKGRFMSQQGRRGGKTKRRDPFQQLLDGIVAENPVITEGQLLERLREHEHISPINDITNETICFSAADGRLRDIRISALKHRLSRTKKKLQSR
jgi:hypothetical protein